MIANSLNIKGLQQGNSREALSFQSQSINSKNPQRERDLASRSFGTKHRQRYLQIFLCLFLMSSFTQLFAQSGASCATSKNLGIGASYSGSQTFNMPSGELWMKFINPANAARITMTPDTNGGSNSLKFKEIYVYLDSCGGKQLFYSSFDTTQVVSFNYLLTQIPVYSNVYIYAKRYIKAGCGGCDTAYKSFSVSLSSNNNLMGGLACNSNLCPNNLVLNGDFEEYSALGTFGMNDFDVCGWSPAYGTPEYYNSDNTSGLLDIPSIYTGSAGVSSYCFIEQPLNATSNIWYNGNTNNAMAGLSMDYSQYDVLEGNLSANLVATQQYFVSFNAINSGADNYAGEFEINFTDDTYSPNNGTDFSSYSNVGLTCSGTPPTSIGQWATYSTVFSATGGENRFHVGNIDNTANTPSLSQGLITVGTLPEYLFVDNFVLTPLAFAGNDVSLCPTATAELGACPIPGASYTWSPTTGLDDPYIANPTATGTGSTITYTVYVTLTIGGTTYTDDDEVVVNAGGTSVTLGASPLVLTSAGTTVLTASPAGAGTYAFYDMASPGTILQNTSSNTYTTSSLSATTTYGVTLTDANGCTAQTTIEILFTATPCNSGSPLIHITSNSTSQLTAGPYSGEAFDVSNGFTFNSDVSFTNCEFWIRDGATVNINSTRTVTMMGGLVRQCDQMWNRISNSGTLIANGTTFTQGDMAVVMNNNSTGTFTDCFFNDNVYGINTLTTTPTKTINLTVTGTTFQHLNGFVTGYSGQPTKYTFPAAGIHLTNCSNTDIGDISAPSNMFRDLYIGIIANSTNTTIANSFFRDFPCTNQNSNVPPAPGTGLAVPYNTSGVAILGKITQFSTNLYTIHLNAANGQALTTNPTISGACFKGILTLGIGNHVNDIIIEDCNVGIQNESVTLINDVEILDCDITTGFQGINWFGSMSGSNLLAQGNTINVTSATYYSQGNGIQLSNNNALAPNSGLYAFPQIIDNNVTLNNIGRGIRINNSSQTIARENTITKDFIGAGFSGFDITGSDSLVINNNELVCTTPFTTNGNGVASNIGIKVSASNDLTIACNSTDGHYYGINFLGDCDGTGANFRTNQIGAHYYGLYYHSTALVGQCLFNGNRWLTTAPTPNAFHARNDNAVLNAPPVCLTNDNSQYLLNEIRTTGVGDVTTTSFPVTANNRQLPNPCAAGNFVVDNTGWITNNTGTDLTCTDPIGASFMMIENMEMRALGMAGALEFNDEIKQNAEEHLYESLQQNSALLNESEILTSFFNDKEGTTLEKQWLVKKLIGEGLNNSYLESMKENSVQINTIQQTLHYLLKNNADSISIRNTKLQLEYYQDIQANLSNTYKSNLLSKRFLASMSNNTIDPGNVIDYNTKEITAIYLNSIYGKDSVDLHSDSTAIYNIAKQCPFSGGNAVYWARAIFELLVPNVNYNDDSICVQIVEERRSNNIYMPTIIEHKSDKIEVYPNPSEGVFTIASISNDIVKYIELFDIIGNKLVEQSILKSQAEVDFSSFGKGSYLLKITDEFNQVIYHKIIIQ